MKQHKRTSLTEGNYKKQILNMSMGMIIGMLGMTIFNIVDTIYVGRLGKEELAALSFTFPVVIIVQSLSLGLGTGLSVVLSQTLGKKQIEKASRVTTDGILLALIIVVIVAIAGMLTIRPLFSLMGARGIVLDNIYSYMRIWYFSAIMVVVPMVGNNAIRATGDTKTPSLIMIISAVFNIILDPVFIFGFGPVPPMGVEGAAIATAIARTISFTSALYILYHREKLITIKRTHFYLIKESWKEILQIGIPTALVRMITPIATGIITGLLASFGTAAVAGFGAGVKIERFALAFTFAVGSAVGPFIGQNIGAQKYERVIKGSKYANKLAFLSGYGVFIILFILAAPISRLFSPVEEVQKIMAIYMRLAGIGYGMQGLYTNCGMILNVLKKPLHAAALSLVQMFVLYIPLAFAGSKIWGVPGVFLALSLSYILSGLISRTVVNKILLFSQSVQTE